MKKLFLFIFFFAFFCFWPLRLESRAAVNTTAIATATAATEEAIYSPHLLPTSPFYFLKELKERIELALALTPVKQVAKRLEIATRRIAELKILAKNSPELVGKQAERYQKEIEKVEGGVKDLSKDEKNVWLVNHVGEMTLKHQAVLLDVLQKVPESAKKGIENALERSLHGYQTATAAAGSANTTQKLQQLIRKVERIETQIRSGEGTGAGVLQQIREELQQRAEEQEGSSRVVPGVIRKGNN